MKSFLKAVNTQSQCSKITRTMQSRHGSNLSDTKINQYYEFSILSVCRPCPVGSHSVGDSSFTKVILKTPMSHPDPQNFAGRVIAWQKQFGRHHLPWQGRTDAYAIWVSEVMLQQTQVKTVLHYYPRFMARFPTVEALACATFADIASVWSGLGYYARARNLHKGAQQVCRDFAGVVPTHVDQLITLAGIGRSTAAAIAVFSVGADAAILDGNVKRILTRYLAIDGVGANLEKKLWPLAETLLPNALKRGDAIKAYTQGLMDLGASVCTRSRPQCSICPLSHDCLAAQRASQSSYPNRPIKKTLPHKVAQFLLLVHDNHVLIETRIEQGIWGGMMALPQLTEFMVKSDFVEQNFAQSGTKLALQRAKSLANIRLVGSETVKLWPKLTHKFTHFALDIYVLEIHVSPALALSSEQLRLKPWWPLHRISEAPMPAPFKKFLQKL